MDWLKKIGEIKEILLAILRFRRGEKYQKWVIEEAILPYLRLALVPIAFLAMAAFWLLEIDWYYALPLALYGAFSWEYFSNRAKAKKGLLPPKDGLFKGTSPFGSNNGEFYRQIGPMSVKGRLEDTLADPNHKLIILTGPAGSGKSSLAAAGLVPTLEDMEVLHVYCDVACSDPQKRVNGLLRERLKPLQTGKKKVTPDPLARDAQERTIVILDNFDSIDLKQPTHRSFIDLMEKYLSDAGSHYVWLLVANEHYSEYWDLEIKARFPGTKPIVMEFPGRPSAKRIIRYHFSNHTCLLKGKVIQHLVESGVNAGKVSPVFLGIVMLRLNKYMEDQQLTSLNLKKFLSDGGCPELLRGYLEIVFKELLREGESERKILAECLLKLAGGEPNGQRFNEFCGGLIEVIGLARAKAVMEELASPRFRVLEKNGISFLPDVRFKLTFPAWEPALRLMTGQIPVEEPEKVPAWSPRRRLFVWGGPAIMVAIGIAAVWVPRFNENRYNRGLFSGTGLPLDFAKRQKRLTKLHVLRPPDDLGWLGRNIGQLELDGFSGNQWKKRFENVTELTLAHSNMGSLNGLDLLPEIKVLNLLENRAIQGLQGIEALGKLEQLRIRLPGSESKGPVVKFDLGPVEEMRMLTFFSFEGHLNCPRLNEVEKLHGLTDLHLRNVELQYMPRFHRHKQLARLSLEKTKLTDLAGLECLNSLQTLVLAENPILADLSAVADLKILFEVKLSSNASLTSIAPLTKVQNLTTLELTGNERLQFVEDLAQLPKVTHLVLGGAFSKTWLESERSFTREIDAIQWPPGLTNLELKGLQTLQRLPKPGVAGDGDPFTLELNSLVLVDLPHLADFEPLWRMTDLKTLILRNLAHFSAVKPANSEGRLPRIPLEKWVIDKTGLKSLDGVQVYRDTLKELTVSGNTHLTDVEPIADLVREVGATSGPKPILTHLELTFNGNQNPQTSQRFHLSFLKGCSSLQNLTLKGDNFTEWAVLGTIPNLVSLSVETKTIKGLDELGWSGDHGETYKIELLDLTGCTGLTSLAGIGALKQLKTLVLTRTQISDLTPLRELPRLESLDIRNLVDDLKFLGDLPETVTEIKIGKSSEKPRGGPE